MSLFENASLIVTPNAQKAGKLYAIKPTSGAGDLDVVRATSRTRVNEQGLVEIPRTNLLLRSEEFDNAAWTKTAGVVITPNFETSPNGTLTASRIDFGASNRILNQTTTLGVGVVASGSIYVKGISGQTIQMAVGGVDVMFTLNGQWQRLTATRTSSNSSFNLNTFGGATARVFSIWGAQIEIGNTATEYIPTTSSIRTRFAGITQDGASASNIPALDYTNGSCPSILVEPQRTNLLLRSEEFDNASWGKTNVTVTANSTTSPNGTITADKLIANTINGTHNINQQLNLPSIGNYTFSCFAKKGEYNILRMVFNNSGFSFIQVNLINGTIVGFGGTNYISSSISDFEDDWFKISMTINVTSIFGQTPILGIENPLNSLIFTGDSTSGIFIWGAQLELGSNATSYIPTVASTVTRNADVISKTGISSLIGQTEGTIYWEGNLRVNTTERRLLSIIGTAGESQRIIIWTLNNLLYATFNTVGVNLGSFPIGTAKIAIGYTISGGNTTYSVKVNNNALITGTAASSPTSLASLALGSQLIANFTLNDRINLVTIWKTRLSNAELATLTTI